MKKTLLIIVVLIASVTSSFAQTAHTNISWTGSTYYGNGNSWILVNGDPYNPSGEPSTQNIQLNINSNLYALELYGYGIHDRPDSWIYLFTYSSNYSYVYELDTYYSSNDYTQIRELFYDTNNPIYVGSFNIFFAAGGYGAGRLVVNWAAV